MIALITPTGGRSKQINLCAEFMRRQDYTGKVLWILIDDVEPKTIDCICIEDGFKKNWELVKVFPLVKWRQGQNTQAKNLLTGIQIVEKYDDIEAVFIIEDDDYYCPQYLRKMMEKLEGYDIVGETNTIYYHIPRQKYRRNRNERYSSLFQTAFTMNTLPLFKKVCKQYNKFIDITLYRVAERILKIKLFNSEYLAVGIKGLPGRSGIGMGHNGYANMNSDPGLEVLKKLLGDDYKYYINEK